MLVQESQQFKHNFLLLFMKLRWFLKRWRQGKVLPGEGDDFLEVSTVSVMLGAEAGMLCRPYSCCQAVSTLGSLWSPMRV